MAKPILMPQVGQDIETGYIGEWLVKEGEFVNKGDIIASVESEKATFDLEAYESGYIIKLLFEPGNEVKVLQPIAYMGEKDEVIDEVDKSIEMQQVELSQKVSREEKQKAEGRSKIFASPSAKRIARDHNIDLTQIVGSGPSGRIIKKDIELFLKSVMSKEAELKVDDSKISEPVVLQSTHAEDVEIPFSKVRQKIAERLLRSKQTIPHFYLFIDVDMTAAVAWRSAYNQKATLKITVNDLIIKATAAALRQFPKINGHVLDQKLIQRKEINIGIAVSVEDGLLVPVIANVDQKNIQQINQLSQKNIEGAKRGSLSTPSVSTFTVSNLGMHGINSVLPIINPPECAILGVGKIEKRVVPLANNAIGIRDYMTLTLACDHRAVDGTYAAQFLDRIKNNLENFAL